MPVHKGKSDPLVCGSNRAIKLQEQSMKVLEKVLEKRIRCQVSIDNMQFVFMPGKGTTDYIFMTTNDTAYKRWSCHSEYKMLCKLWRSLPPPEMWARFTVFWASRTCGPAG